MIYIPHTVGGLIALALNLLVWLIIVEVVVSWLIYLRKLSPYAGFVRSLRKIVDPILAPVRRVLPASKTGGMDFSPVVVILVIQFITNNILLRY